MKISTRYSGASGLYVQLSPTDGFAAVYKAVSQQLESFDIPLDPREELHCTMMYSREVAPHPLQVARLTEDSNIVFPADVTGVDYWPGHDNSHYIVLKLESKSLQDRHRQWRRTGAKHSFPDFLAHITLAHGFDVSAFNVKKVVADINKKIAAANFKIRLSGEHAEDIKGSSS